LLGLEVFFSGISLSIIGEYIFTSTNIISKVFMILDICLLISLILLLVGIEKVNKFSSQLKNKYIYVYIYIYLYIILNLIIIY